MYRTKILVLLCIHFPFYLHITYGKYDRKVER